MRLTQNERTLNDILRYIKANSRDGFLKESMVKIGERTGYSNATVHRSIKALERKGMIQIIETKSARTPNTICYIGPNKQDISDLLHRADAALATLFQATEQVQDVMIEMRETMQLVQMDESYIQLQ